SEVAGSEKARAQPMSSKQAADIGQVFELLGKLGSPVLRADIAKSLASLGKFEGMALDRLFPVPRRPAAAKPVTQKVAAKKTAAKKVARTSAAKKPRRKG
ncbi:MAG TPA: hypothetical protein VET87_17605, partial [Rubrivivax sp.]|nr:hypothetical protein [Rubrivivax sp.]